MPEVDLPEVGTRLVQTATDAGANARLLGGVAVALHCPSAGTVPFQRAYEDIDVMFDKRSRKQIDEVVGACGFAPDAEFNNIHGLERRAYYSETNGKLDVFVGEFSMCHTLSFEGRLNVDTPTVALADLVLTKAQIFELNRKDAYDLLTLLADHPVGSGDEETISTERIAEVCGNDWGIWRTVGRTLETVEQFANTDDALAPSRQPILAAILAIREAMTTSRKSTKWKMRARIGERKAWYVLPEDPERHHAAA